MPPLSTTRQHTINCQAGSRVGTAQRVTREILVLRIQTSLVSQRTEFINYTWMIVCSEEVRFNRFLRAWLTSIDSCALGSLQSSDCTSWATVVGSDKANQNTTQNTTLIKQVMKAVHSDFISKKQRATSIVVSGLRPGADTSDTKLFENLIATNLNMNIVPTSCKRLGALKEDKIQPLLVVLPSVDLTENLFSKVKMLRNSQSEYTRQHVYINRFLTLIG